MSNNHNTQIFNLSRITLDIDEDKTVKKVFIKDLIVHTC